MAETVLDSSSEGAGLMDVFSFPRARTAPRQVSECITPDGNHGAVKSLLCWLLAPGSRLLGPLPRTNYSILELTGLLPESSRLELSRNAWLSPKCSPHSFYLAPPCLGSGFVQRGGCAASFQRSRGCICAAERADVPFRSVDLQISAEKRKGSQVLVLEAQRA